MDPIQALKDAISALEAERMKHFADVQLHLSAVGAIDQAVAEMSGRLRDIGRRDTAPKIDGRTREGRAIRGSTTDATSNVPPVTISSLEVPA